jgi:methyl-accepting chemotaxis protein
MLDWRWRYSLKIKQKLMLILFLLIVIPILLIQFFASIIIQSRMEANQKDQVEYVRNNLSSTLQGYQSKLLNYIRFLRTEQSIVDTAFIATLTLDSNRLVSELKRHAETLDIDSLEVLDRSGRVIARGHVMEGKEDTQTTLGLVKEALSSKTSFDFDHVNGRYAIYAAGPIVKESGVIAIIMAGIFFDESLAQQLKALSGAEILFEFNDRISVSTIQLKQPDAVGEALRGIQERRLVELDGVPYDVTYLPVQKTDRSEIGRLYLAVSLASIVEAKLEMRGMLLVVTVISLAMALGIGYLLSDRFSSQLSKGVALAQSVAEGDLTRQMEIKTEDEIGRLGRNLNEMTGRLKAIIDKIQESAVHTTTVVEEINTSTKQLSEGSSAQAESVETTTASISEMNSSIKSVAESVEGLAEVTSESASSVLELTASIDEVAHSANTLSSMVETTASSIEEMTAAIGEIAEHVEVLLGAAERTSTTLTEFNASLKGIEGYAKESATLSEHVRRNASELGMQAVEKTIEGMSEIQVTVKKAEGVMNQWSERSEQVGKILRVIEEVTRQTNLLALNAAILAAQAGEQGKGFAVVSEEIKNLADRTAGSTREIGQLIENIQREARDATEAIREGSSKVEEGMRRSREASEALSKIVESSNRSNEMALRIKQATQEQGGGVQQVEKAMRQISEMVQQIARATKEQRRGTEQITGAVEGMRQVSQQTRQATVEQAKVSRQINEVVAQVNDRARSILSATKEQSKGSEMIVAAAENIRQVTQQNQALASEVKQAVEILKRQAELLRTEVKRFKV